MEREIIGKLNVEDDVVGCFVQCRGHNMSGDWRVSWLCCVEGYMG